MCGFAQERFFPQFPPTSDPGAISCCSVRLAGRSRLSVPSSPHRELRALHRCVICKLQPSLASTLQSEARGKQEDCRWPRRLVCLLVNT